MAKWMTNGNALAGLYNIRSAAGTSFYWNWTGIGNNTKYVKAVQSDTNTLNGNRAKFRLIWIKNEKANTNTSNISWYAIVPAYEWENNSGFISCVRPFKHPYNDWETPNLSESELRTWESIPTTCWWGLYYNGDSLNTISIINYETWKDKNSITGDDAFWIMGSSSPTVTYQICLKVKNKVNASDASGLCWILEKRKDEYIRIGSHWKEIAQPYIKIDNVWKPVVATYVKIGGYWKIK